MKFYTTQHPYYCGIDLHIRSLYVCILDAHGETSILHRQIKALPEPLFDLLAPYIGNIVVGVECMHCWYWVSDFCAKHGIDFILGHALYMKAIHGGKAKNDRIDSDKIAHLIRGGNFPLVYVYPSEMRSVRDLLRRRTRITRHGADLKAHVKNTTSQYNLPPNNLDLKYPCAREAMRDCFDDKFVQRNIDLDLNIIAFYRHELSAIEWFIEKHAKHHNGNDYHILTSFPGIGRIMADHLYEVGDIARFNTVQDFASYSRLISAKPNPPVKLTALKGIKSAMLI